MGQEESKAHKSNVDNQSVSICTNDDNNDKTSNIEKDMYDRQLLKRCEHIDFDVENWYPILQFRTFYTEFIRLCPSTAKAFVHYYQQRYNSRNIFNSNDLKLIRSMEYKLKQILVNSGTNSFTKNGAFVRLSSRSSKDGNPLNSELIKQFYAQKFNTLKIRYSNKYDSIEDEANMKLIAYFHAQFECLKINDEREALNLILSSERVFVDLLLALDCYEIQNKAYSNENNITLHDWNNHIIIRQWNDSLDPSMEFRCFVYQSKLTAISQYNHYCKFYHLQNDLLVQHIKMTIIKYWDTYIKVLLEEYKTKYINYIIDIALIENELTKNYDCIVIELNPFETTTGAALFDWKNDYDQLKGKPDEIEIRIRSNLIPNIVEYTDFLLNERNRLINDHDFEPYFVYLNRIQQ